MEFIIEAFLFQLMFIVLYYMFKNETFFNYNRIYLLITSVLSYVLPFVKFEALETTYLLINTVNILPTVFLGDTTQVLVTPINASLFSWHWWYLPVLGSTGMLAVFMLKVWKLIKLSKNGQVIKGEEFRLVTLKNSRSAFSFFHWIFIGDQLKGETREIILAHELIHVKEKHSLDLLFFEIQRIVCWFNPLVYQYQKEIQSLHEFIVDSQMIQKSGSQTYCKNILTQLFNAPKLSFVNTFYKQSLIKKRIVMITKKESKFTATFKYAFIIPVVTGMLFYTSCQQNEKEVEEQASLEVQDSKISMKKNFSETDGLYDTIFIDNGTSEDIRKEVNKIMKLKRRDKKSYLVMVKETSEIVSKRLSAGDTDRINFEEGEDVPFTAIQNPAVFPGCEEAEDSKKCFSDKMSRHIAKNFNTGLAEELGLTGVQRMAAMFKIDTNGDITDIRVRAKNEELKQEFEKTIQSLPQMEPATQNGVKVNLLFSLPLVFRIETDDKEKVEE